MPQFILSNSMNAEIKAIKTKNSSITSTCNPILETNPTSNNPALPHITCKKNLPVQSNTKPVQSNTKLVQSNTKPVQLNTKSNQKSNKTPSLF